MRDGLKKRIAPKAAKTNPKKNVYTFGKYNVQYKSKTYQKNVTPPDNSCKYDAACEDGESNLSRRRYYAPFRQPVRGKRYQGKNNVSFIRKKDLTREYKDNRNTHAACGDVVDGNDTSNKVECLWTQMPTDSYDTCKMNANDELNGNPSFCSNATKSTTRFPDASNTDVSYSGNYARTNRPLIRSGMLPNTAGQQNSGFYDNRKTYSYSYNELIRRRRKDTYVAQLPDYNNSSGRGKIDECCSKTTIKNYKKKADGSLSVKTRGNYSNDKFKVQGAVESSSRIDRLKLDTLRGISKCDPPAPGGKQLCNGKYFAGKPRFISLKQNVNTGGEPSTIPAAAGRRRLINSDAVNALRRVRGGSSSISNTEAKKCCNPNLPPRNKSTKC